MSDLESRLEYIRGQVSISQIYPEARANGSSICPCCKGVGKFYVTKDLYFKCFSTKCELNSYKLGSDVVALYRYLHNLEEKRGFFTALEQLEGGYGATTYAEVKNERSVVLEKVLELYQYYLWSARGTEALAYLRSRGFMDETLKICGVGYAPDSYSLRAFDIKELDLQREGLLEDGREYFSKRLIFPIRDKGGLVHFTGRYLGNVPTDDQGTDLLPRYKDTKANRSLFGSKSYLAFGDCLSNCGSSIYLVEGFPDAMSLQQVGIPAVGLLGLEKLVEQASNFAKFSTITAVFDNDRYASDHPYACELKSWRRIIPQLIDLQIILPTTQFKVLIIPEDSGAKDINEWMLRRNAGAFTDLVNSTAMDLVEYLILNWKGDINKHYELVRLVSITGRGISSLSAAIPNDVSALDYAMRLFK